MLGLMEKTLKNMITFENLQQRDNDTTACLLDNPYFKDHYKLSVTDLMK